MASFILASSLIAALFILTLYRSAIKSIHFPYGHSKTIEEELLFPTARKLLFSGYGVDGILFTLIFEQNLLRFFIAAVFALALYNPVGYFWIFPFFLILLCLFLFAECIPQVIAGFYPEKSLKLSKGIVSVLLIPLFPLAALLLRLFGRYLHGMTLEKPMMKTKREIIEIIQESKLTADLTLQDKQLIEAVLTFKDRIAREVMVPRVDVFTLSSDTPIKEAAEMIDKEGYSRIPVWQNSVDNIVGVVMYKDIVRKYMEFEQEYEEKGDSKILEAPIRTIQKNILYTPETKKISNLLLEFRKKQSHLAIVVDEYGGTEGIVTIEDILEEIVGEIADEYDDEEDLYTGQPDGSFFVDARMNILDAQEQLLIEIPQEGEYDTIGGYIFHTAGTIPPKGFQIHQETFELEVISSDERRVQKVKIMPLK